MKHLPSSRAPLRTNGSAAGLSTATCHDQRANSGSAFSPLDNLAKRLSFFFKSKKMSSYPENKKNAHRNTHFKKKKKIYFSFLKKVKSLFHKQRGSYVFTLVLKHTPVITWRQSIRDGKRSENSSAHVWSEAGLSWYRQALDTCCKSQERTHDNNPQWNNIKDKPKVRKSRF